MNRSILVVRPGAPFRRWLAERYEEEEPDPFQPTAYLIPSCETEEECWEWLEVHFDTVFTMELDAWYTDPSGWPDERSWEQFLEWFDLELIDLAWDLVDEPLSSSPPPRSADA